MATDDYPVAERVDYDAVSLAIDPSRVRVILSEREITRPPGGTEQQDRRNQEHNSAHRPNENKISDGFRDRG